MQSTKIIAESLVALEEGAGRSQHPRRLTSGRKRAPG